MNFDSTYYFFRGNDAFVDISTGHRKLIVYSPYFSIHKHFKSTSNDIQTRSIRRFLSSCYFEYNAVIN